MIGAGRLLEEYADAEDIRIASLALNEDELVSYTLVDNETRYFETIVDELDLPAGNSLLESFKNESKKPNNEVTMVDFCPVEFEESDSEDEIDHSFGRFIKILPYETIQFILLFLPEDSVDMLKTCNRKWYCVCVSECYYKHLCRWVFSQPGYRPVQTVELSVGKVMPIHAKSWYTLSKRRPRARQLHGVYALRKLFVRDPGPRSMWTTEYSPVCECMHYRYMLFLPNGELYYASTPHAFKKMVEAFKRLSKQNSYAEEGDLLNIGSSNPQRRNKNPWKNKIKTRNEFEKADKVFYGSYIVTGKTVHVVVNLVNFSVRFTLEIKLDRNGSFDHLYTVLHQSLYHREGENVIDYPLSQFYSERLWKYYSFDYYDK